MGEDLFCIVFARIILFSTNIEMFPTLIFMSMARYLFGAPVLCSVTSYGFYFDLLFLFEHTVST